MNDDIRKYRTIITESYVLDSRPDEVDALLDSIKRVDEMVPFLAPLVAVGGPAIASTLGRIGVQRLIQGAVPKFAPKVANWLARGAATSGAARTAATGTAARSGAGMFSQGTGKFGIGSAGAVAGNTAAGAARSGSALGTIAKKGAEVAGMGAAVDKLASKGLKGIKKIGKDVIEDTAESFLETPAGQRMDNASPQTLQQSTERVLVQNGCEPEAADGFIDVLKRSGLFAGGAMGLMMLFMIISYLIANPQAVQQIAQAFGDK